MQNLEPILIFITVAEMGSFTHAADSLGIQKGRASTAVRKKMSVSGSCTGRRVACS
jgi:Bacterial regulatory helix-turn-helix protein, lysR family